MNTNDLLVDALRRNQNIIQMTLADFTDADMLVRPADGANHAAWQLGHLAVAEVQMIGATTGKKADLPAGFAEVFTRKTSASDDAAAFPKKAELLEAFARARQASIEWAQSVSADDLDRPSPESIRAFAPRLGDLATVLSEHAAMHIGQFQVIRRKLGKPVLF